jgi:hypothetical protein
VKENFARYGLALLPLVLAGYMAFHFYYLINLGVYFPILLWETFKFELFKQMVITVPPSLLLFLQKFIVFLGVIGSTVLAFRLAKGRTPVIRDVLKEFAPHAIVVFLFYFALIHALEECFR